MDQQLIDTQELGQQGANGVPPLLDAQPQGISEEPDFKTLFEQSEAEKRRMAEELGRVSAAQQQQNVQQIDQMWAQAEQVAWQQADEMEPAQAKQYMVNFYRERDNYKTHMAQAALRNIGVKAWKDELRKRYELTDDEMTMLGTDPELMETNAKHLKRTRDQIEQVRAEAGVHQAATRGRERLQSGAGVPLGGNRGPSGAANGEPTYEKGTRAHLLDLINSGVI